MLMSDPTVEMFRRQPGSSARDRFSCSERIWSALWELGQAFGWQPMGTTYVVPARRKVEVPARHNYEPGNALDQKRIEAEDAAAWARALTLAKESPHAAAMIEAQFPGAGLAEPSGELFASVLDEFVEFAHGGAFEFADHAGRTTAAH